MMTTVTRGKVLHYIFIKKFKYGKKYKHGHYTMIHIWALHMGVHKCQFMPIKFLKIVKFLNINLSTSNYSSVAGKLLSQQCNNVTLQQLTRVNFVSFTNLLMVSLLQTMAGMIDIT